MTEHVERASTIMRERVAWQARAYHCRDVNVVLLAVEDCISAPERVSICSVASGACTHVSPC
jgi:hypothetical protein